MTRASAVGPEEELGGEGPAPPGAAGPVRVGILTVSDGVAAGARQDDSGDLIARWVESRGYRECGRTVVPDETGAIVRMLLEWADGRTCDLILTTGGTGLAERDVTPEATRATLDREAPGLAERIRRRGASQTPYAALSRGITGVRAATLIVNLPGSPSGVEDGLSVLAEVVDHAVDLLRGHTRHD